MGTYPNYSDFDGAICYVHCGQYATAQCVDVAERHPAVETDQRWVDRHS